MRDVWILGSASTAFGKRPDDTFKALTAEVYRVDGVSRRVEGCRLGGYGGKPCHPLAYRA